MMNYKKFQEEIIRIVKLEKMNFFELEKIEEYFIYTWFIREEAKKRGESILPLVRPYCSSSLHKFFEANEKHYRKLLSKKAKEAIKFSNELIGLWREEKTRRK